MCGSKSFTVLLRMRFWLTGVRQQPWSTYAVQLTTLSPPALVGDAALWWFLVYGTWEWSSGDKWNAYYLLAAWMTASKFVKLVPHFIRFPVDIFLWPASVLFGWCHGIIKWHAMLTLNEVSCCYPYAGSSLTNNRQLGDLEQELTHPIRRGWSSRTKSTRDNSTTATKKHSSRRCLLLMILRTHRLWQPELLLAWRWAAKVGMI